MVPYSPAKVKMVKSRAMKWDGGVDTREEMRNSYQIVVGFL
jgi:hypothetical protein